LPDRFDRRWSAGLWVDYELRDADMRDVVVGTGNGRLRDLNALAGTVALNAVGAGEAVVVRMNYFPAWTARAGSQAVPLRSVDGQLAFEAPADGSYDVVLEYPRRRGLILVSLMGLIAGCVVLARYGSFGRR
jgi:hypothetical protein